MNKPKTERRDHDFCSPSQLERRWKCPGSVRMEQQIVKPKRKDGDSTPEASRGRALHAVIEKLLKQELGITDVRRGLEVNGYTLNHTDADHALWCYGCAQAEIDSISMRKAILIEQPVDLELLGIGGGLQGNRPDLAIVVPGHFIVGFDWKMGGAWVTPPKWNLQFRTYGWGLWNRFGGRSVKWVKLQPFLEEELRYMEYSYTPQELEQARKDVTAIVERTKDPDAPLMRGGHCQYCTAKDICPHFRGALLEIPPKDHVATYLASLDPRQARELYNALLAAQEWVNNGLAACQGYSLERMLADPKADPPIAGTMVGHKTTRRKWKDDILPKLAEYAKEHNVNPSDLVETKLLSPATLEKLFPKKLREGLAEFQEKPEGDPILVEDPTYRAPEIPLAGEEDEDAGLLV